MAFVIADAGLHALNLDPPGSVEVAATEAATAPLTGEHCEAAHDDGTGGVRHGRAAFRSTFDALGVLIIRSDDDGARSQALRRVVEDVSARTATKIELDFLVISPPRRRERDSQIRRSRRFQR
jgi:hypothetical protein